MKNLELWSEYTREEIHSIFSPDTTFTPQAGTWGLHGMVRVPDRLGDWVFLVSLGNQQGEHLFDESITVDGVLSWQSQPRLDLNCDVIQSLISHDDRINNIHLFLRTKKGNPYGYFGCLGYLTHDREREKPVYFQWQILYWPAPEAFLDQISLELTGENPEPETKVAPVKLNELIFVDPPKASTRNTGIKTSEFRRRKFPDYGLIDSKNKKLGLDGELLVLDQEIRTLRRLNLHDLADKVLHVSVVEGDGAGYDIRSYDEYGNVKYIEVKTTKGLATTSFFISPNELEFSKHHQDSYLLYRLYDFDVGTSKAKVFILKGDLSSQLDIIPTQFKAQLIEIIAS
jgi:hypothetical protein